MPDKEPLQVQRPPIGWRTIARSTAYILVALLVFLFSLELMLSALQSLGKEEAESIILATSNPFTSFFIGLLVTAIIQSSTATTSMAVTLMATGTLTLETAVPLIMGANIGTTITSTIVALGFLPRKKEFRRAVAAGTYHDFFNILTAAILFPLEYYFQFLSGISNSLAHTFFPAHPSSGGEVALLNQFSPATDWLARMIPYGPVLILISLVILFGSILFFRRVLSNMLGLGMPEQFQRFFFQRPAKSFAWGLLTTAAIRSSSVTTSLAVPLVAKRVVSLKGAVPFILGANIGTTLSAFVAAFANSNAAMSLAIAHFLFNVFGFLIFYPVSALRRVPIELAKGLGRITTRYRLAWLIYLLSTFFFIPFSLIYLNRDAVTLTELTYETQSNGDRRIDKVITRTLHNQSVGRSAQYVEGQSLSSQLTYSVYRSGRLLLLRDEVFELRQPGFCQEGEDRDGRFRKCLLEMIPHYRVNETLQADSVYVFEKIHEAAGVPLERSYVSASLNLLIVREQTDSAGRLLARQALIARTLK